MRFFWKAFSGKFRKLLKTNSVVHKHKRASAMRLSNFGAKVQSGKEKKLNGTIRGKPDRKASINDIIVKRGREVSGRLRGSEIGDYIVQFSRGVYQEHITLREVVTYCVVSKIKRHSLVAVIKTDKPLTKSKRHSNSGNNTILIG